MMFIQTPAKLPNSLRPKTDSGCSLVTDVSFEQIAVLPTRADLDLSTKEDPEAWLAELRRFISDSGILSHVLTRDGFLNDKGEEITALQNGEKTLVLSHVYHEYAVTLYRVTFPDSDLAPKDIVALPGYTPPACLISLEQTPAKLFAPLEDPLRGQTKADHLVSFTSLSLGDPFEHDQVRTALIDEVDLLYSIKGTNRCFDPAVGDMREFLTQYRNWPRTSLNLRPSSKAPSDCLREIKGSVLMLNIDPYKALTGKDRKGPDSPTILLSPLKEKNKEGGDANDVLVTWIDEDGKKASVRHLLGVIREFFPHFDLEACSSLIYCAGWKGKFPPHLSLQVKEPNFHVTLPSSEVILFYALRISSFKEEEKQFATSLGTVGSQRSISNKDWSQVKDVLNVHRDIKFLALFQSLSQAIEEEPLLRRSVLTISVDVPGTEPSTLTSQQLEDVFYRVISTIEQRSNGLPQVSVRSKEVILSLFTQGLQINAGGTQMWDGLTLLHLYSKARYLEDGGALEAGIEEIVRTTGYTASQSVGRLLWLHYRRLTGLGWWQGRDTWKDPLPCNSLADTTSLEGVKQLELTLGGFIRSHFAQYIPKTTNLDQMNRFFSLAVISPEGEKRVVGDLFSELCKKLIHHGIVTLPGHKMKVRPDLLYRYMCKKCANGELPYLLNDSPSEGLSEQLLSKALKDQLELVAALYKKAPVQVAALLNTLLIEELPKLNLSLTDILSVLENKTAANQSPEKEASLASPHPSQERQISVLQEQETVEFAYSEVASEQSSLNNQSLSPTIGRESKSLEVVKERSPIALTSNAPTDDLHRITKLYSEVLLLTTHVRLQEKVGTKAWRESVQHHANLLERAVARPLAAQRKPILKELFYWLDKEHSLLISASKVGEPSFAADVYEELLRRTALAIENETVLPNFLRTNPFFYQLFGISFLTEKKGAILGDEVGLGKTIQALGASELLAEKQVLWITTASNVGAVVEEILLHTRRGADDVLPLYGTSKLSTISKLPKYIVAGYETVREIHRNNGAFHSRLSKECGILIVDEAQCMTNPQALRTRAIRTLEPERRWLLTATPYFSKVRGMWTLMNFIDPQTFHSFSLYHHLFEKNAFSLKYLNLTLAPYMLRRTKEDVAREFLPQKIQSFSEQLRDPSAVRIPRHTLRIKEEFGSFTLSEDHARLILETDVGRTKSSSEDQTFGLAGNLWKAVYFPEMFSPRIVNPFFVEALRCVEKEIDQGRKVILWALNSEYVQQLSLLCVPYGAVKIDGEVTGQERNVARTLFQKDPNVRVLVGNLLAGSVGLTLTAATTAIYVQPPITYPQLYQALGRHHRIIGRHAMHLAKEEVFSGFLVPKYSDTFIEGLRTALNTADLHLETVVQRHLQKLMRGRTIHLLALDGLALPQDLSIRAQ